MPIELVEMQNEENVRLKISYLHVLNPDAKPGVLINH